ncbi:Zn-ribbon domain-containing OB-fold protein [Microbacterium sp.]|uniref:Zn-ribbon domain-containing OB-fold protein n=1 Tax=Microbacterium sp. TaxID=51671 RepID=UPI0039E72085
MTVKNEAPVSQPIADLETDSLLGEFPEGRRLIGTRCRACGRTMIGSRVVCSSCVSRDVERVALPANGVLYSFTRIHGRDGDVRPLGYVDLDDDVRTLTDLRETAPLVPGIRVELQTEGDEWFFVPADGQ